MLSAGGKEDSVDDLNPFELASPTTSEEGGASASLPDLDSDDVDSPLSGSPDEGAHVVPPPCPPSACAPDTSVSTEHRGERNLTPGDVLCDTEDARAILSLFCSSFTAPCGASRAVLEPTRLACTGASGDSGSDSDGFAAEFGADVGSDEDEDTGSLGGKRRGGRGEFASADDWAARIETAEAAAAKGPAALADERTAHRPRAPRHAKHSRHGTQSR